ncbi:MAG: CBS domain-containing protein [Betaproteobacteria bacterium]|nr:CBS domain-containing protein [Betaproteobacteria bacterium]
MREGVKCLPSGYWYSTRLRADSPAIDAMTDLRKVMPATITADASLTLANQTMIARSVRLLLVVNDKHEIVGLITARDTMGEKPVKTLRERGGTHGELKVADLMVPRNAIDVIDISTVERAEVGHVVATLKELGRQHALVVEKDALSGEEVLRGIFSATQISRLVSMTIHTFEIAHTFAQIESELAK